MSDMLKYGDIVGETIISITSDITKNAISNAPFNKIERGIIVAVDNTHKKYSVLIKGTAYKNIQKMVLPYELQTNDSVLCLVPNNQLSNMIILGKLDK